MLGAEVGELTGARIRDVVHDVTSVIPASGFFVATCIAALEAERWLSQ